MLFEWDEFKNEANIAKHGIDLMTFRISFSIQCWPYAMIERIVAKSDGSVLAGSNC